MKIYVASSWRNEHQQQVVAELRNAGFDVYDFKHPAEGNVGFHWSEIDKNWQNWTIDQYRMALGHDYAQFGFNRDFDAMKDADACVLVLPCGRSAHLEAGWMKGAGRKVVAFIPSGCRIEPELMYNLLDGVTSDTTEVISMLKEAEGIKMKDEMKALDAQKARDVLDRVHKFLGILIRENLVKDAPFLDEGELENEIDLADDVWEVLHSKPRNCDGTSEEQAVRFDGMTFGMAIEAMKHGEKVARKGWNGKGMYLWILPAASVKAEWCKEPHLKTLAEQNGGEVECLGSVRMKTADGKVLTGWLASQTDMLSDDWQIVD